MTATFEITIENNFNFQQKCPFGITQRHADVLGQTILEINSS